MTTVRTNLCPNPRYIGQDGKGGGGSASWTQADVTSGSPDSGGHTRIDVTATQTGTVEIGTDDTASTPVTPGQVYTLSTHANVSHRATLGLRAVATWQDAAGAIVATTAGTEEVATSTTGWFRYPVTAPAPTGASQVQIRLRISIGTAPLDVGDIVRIGQRMVETGDQLKAYFDGDYPDTEFSTYAWTGEPNASASTETYTGPPSITASVLTREVPVAQVVVTNLPAGATYEIIGTAAGYTWPIPGGVGVADGEQLELVDTRAPFNVPVTYQLTYNDAGYDDSNTVTLPLTTGADVVLATIDGALEAVPTSLGAGDFPRAVVPRSKVYEVPGRPRGPVRWAPAGRAGSTWVLHCDIRQSADLDRLLATGRPLVYRLATPVRDLAPTDLIVVTEVDSVSFPDEDAWRTWTISFEYIDDPEPSTKPVVTSWDQFDVIYADDTWDAFDAQWANQTWDDFDAFDWGQLQ